MDGEPQARTRMSLANLIDTLDRFISDNSHSRDVEERWLCAVLASTLQLTREARSRLGPENKAKVNAFRADEIEKELQAKRRETEILERDLVKLRAPAAS